MDSQDTPVCANLSQEKTKGKIGAIGAIRHGFMQEKLYTLSD